jgi:hypothetical protein
MGSHQSSKVCGFSPVVECVWFLTSRRKNNKTKEKNLGHCSQAWFLSYFFLFFLAAAADSVLNWLWNILSRSSCLVGWFVTICAMYSPLLFNFVLQR